MNANLIHAPGNILHLLKACEACKSCTWRSVKALGALRVKRHRKYKLIPVFYLVNPFLLSSCERAVAAAFAFISLLTLLVGLPIFLHFYVFEADVKLIYVDTFKDYAREIETGNSVVGVLGWKYSESIEEDPQQQQQRSTKEMSKKRKLPYEIERDKSSSGYWTLNHNNPNSIELKEFQLFYSHQATLAIRYYIHGKGKLLIDFQSVNGEQSTVSIFNDDQMEKERNGLCTQFIEPPFQGFVEKIKIRGYIDTQESFITVDKVLVALGNDHRGLHMLYTLLPSGWCSRGVISKLV